MSRLVLGWRDILLWQSCPLSKEKLFHLLHDGFLVLAACGVQAILVQQHFAKLRPLVPGLLRHVLIHALSQFGVERRLVQTGQVLLQLNAENSVFRHGYLRGESARYERSVSAKLTKREVL